MLQSILVLTLLVTMAQSHATTRRRLPSRNIKIGKYYRIRPIGKKYKLTVVNSYELLGKCVDFWEQHGTWHVALSYDNGRTEKTYDLNKIYIKRIKVGRDHQIH